MTIAASGSSFSYSAAVVVAITTDVAAVAAVAAAAMIAAAANSGFTIIHKRDIGQKTVRYPQKVASRSNSAGIFLLKINRI